MLCKLHRRIRPAAVAAAIPLLVGSARAAPFPQATTSVTTDGDSAGPTLTISGFLPSALATVPLVLTGWKYGSTGLPNTTVYASGLVTETIPATTVTTSDASATDTITFLATTLTQNRTAVAVYGPSTILEYGQFPDGTEGEPRGQLRTATALIHLKNQPRPNAKSTEIRQNVFRCKHDR